MSESQGCSGNCSGCDKKGSSVPCQVREALAQVRRKIVVMSGKGGVGKSTVAVNLALALALEGRSVGLLDVDIHGPSVPKMLHLENASPETRGDKMLPVELGSLKVMSIGFLLESPDSPVIWRGPVKIGVIQQFLTEVEWGALDYLVIDSPPGTGDEPLSVCQFLPDAEAVIVTTPQAVAATDVAKSLSFCEQLKLKVLGVVENMSGFVCPKCGEFTPIFSSGAGEELSRRFHVPLLGKIPIDPAVCQGGDSGLPFIRSFASSAAGQAFAQAIRPILDAE